MPRLGKFPLNKFYHLIGVLLYFFRKNYSYLFYHKQMMSFLSENYNILPGFISNKIIQQVK